MNISVISGPKTVRFIAQLAFNFPSASRFKVN